MGTVYIAGPIDYTDRPDLNRYPDAAARYLVRAGHSAVVPYSAFAGHPKEYPQWLRTINSAAVRASDALLAAVAPEVPSWGTPVEIGWAEQQGHPVVLWAPDGELPPYFMHLPSHERLETAVGLLDGLLQGKRPGGGPQLMTTSPGAIDAPKKAGDAGYDVRSAEDLVLEPGESARIACGAGGEELRVAVPPGRWASPFVRSSWVERGLWAAPTVIEQYRGPIYIFATNVGDAPIDIEVGDRIAQLVLFPLVSPPLVGAERLPPSERGTDGFGSTGRK